MRAWALLAVLLLAGCHARFVDERDGGPPDAAAADLRDGGTDASTDAMVDGGADAADGGADAQGDAR